MKKMKMCFPREKRFVDGFAEYILDCKARNLREGTINHYRESIKQIYKRIPPDTSISSLNQQTMKDFYIALRDDPNLNEVSMGTYARDLKTLMRFFMKCGYIPHFEIQLPKADKAPIQTYTDDELKKLLKKPEHYPPKGEVRKAQRAGSEVGSPSCEHRIPTASRRHLLERRSPHRGFSSLQAYHVLPRVVPVPAALQCGSFLRWLQGIVSAVAGGRRCSIFHSSP